MATPLHELRIWPAWRKISFRFAFAYLIFYSTPWMFISNIPYSDVIYLDRPVIWYYEGWNWMVTWSNDHIFHLKDQLVPFNGSGDTSFGWAQLCFGLLLAAIICLIWSIIDRRRNNYEVLDYWFRLSLRYYLSYYCFVYGIIKIFGLQMPFPNLSQLATPLGDFLPMRLSWMFIGYSFPYQMFSGVMETLAGLLLLNRRTVTLGLFVASGVFVNVFVMNLAYDIPVKLFSGHLLLVSGFLLLYEAKRLIDFFILNRVADADNSFNVELSKRWMQWTRVGLKITFVLTAFIIPIYESYGRYNEYAHQPDLKPINSGFYDVDLFVLNGKDTIPPLLTDTTRWQDVVFDKGGLGSIKTTDPMFRQRYRRGYFNYKPDTTNNTIGIKYMAFDTVNLMTMRYELPDEKTILLWTKLHNDSLFVHLTRSNRHFQLTERQFHWLSEANR